MKRNWFRKSGPIYLPNSPVGWLLTLATGFLAVRTFQMVDRWSHSASDTLLGAGPIIALMVGLLWLLATKSSDPDDGG